MSFGLVGAAMASGFGQGVGKGLEDAQKLNFTKDLEDARQAHDDLRQQRGLDAQSALQEKTMTHAEKLQTSQFAANIKLHDLQNVFTHSENELGRNATAEAATKHADLTKELQAATLAANKEIATNSMSHADRQDQTKFGQQVALAGIVREAAKDGYTVQTGADGSLFKLDGHGNLSPVMQDGKPFKGLHDWTGSQKALGEIMTVMIKGNDRELQNPLIAPERRDSLQKENHTLYQNMTRMADPENRYGMQDKAAVPPGLKAATPDQAASYMKANAQRLQDPTNHATMVQELVAKGIDPQSVFGAKGTPQSAPVPVPSSDNGLIPGVPEKQGLPPAPGSTKTVPMPDQSTQENMGAAMQGGLVNNAVPPQVTPPPQTAPEPESADTGSQQEAAQELANRQTSPGGLANQGTPPDQRLTPKDLATLLTKDERKSITSLLDKITKPGVKEKPATREDLKDRLLTILGPKYARNNQPPKELVADVNALMAQLLPAQPDMSGNGYKYAVTP